MKLKTILTIAILLRILLIPYFYHPDMKSQNFHFQYLSQGIFNIYQYVQDNKQLLPYRDTFNYLPLTYFTFGSSQMILKPIMPVGFSKWINDWGPNQNNYPNLVYYLLILKIPYIILDFGIGLLLFKITQSKKIYAFWLLNPITFYLIYILGNFDVLPVFLTLLSFFLISKSPRLSFIIFGLAIALKLYPLIFLPFYIFYSSKKIKYIVLNSLLALLPVFLTIIPFATNQAFWNSFFGSGLTQKIFELKYLFIPIFPSFYLIILGIAYFSKNINLPKYIFYIFLLFASTVNFHPQWILWFFPFIFLINPQYLKQNAFPILIIFISIGIYILLFNDSFLSWGHLIPIDLDFINQTTPYELLYLKFLVNPHTIQLYSRYSIIVISVLLIKNYEKNNSHN